jgi:5-methylcytosine-specific restriction endonuclease McrA
MRAWFALFALTVAACAPSASAHSRCVKVERGNAVAQFKRANPCPAGPDAGSQTRCAGYEAHHVVPLMCGGPDELENLVWLKTEQHHALHSAMICRCDVVRGERGGR